MEWAAVHIIQVIPFDRQIGYAAAARCFTSPSECMILLTQALKKDFHQTATAPIALHALAHIVTPDLAVDLLPDLMVLICHSKPEIRSRAIVAIYRCIRMYPEGLSTAFSKLKDSVVDPSQSTRL